VIVLSRRQLVSLCLLFIYDTRSGLALIATYIQSYHFGNDIDMALCREVSGRLDVAVMWSCRV
jgi:hypothetical protein